MGPERPAGEVDTDDLSVRTALPRTVGATLAVNAVPDAYLLLDSPHCTFRRIAYVQGNHDHQSTLTLYPGTPRVTNTEITPLEVIRNRDEAIGREILALTRNPNAGVVLVDAMALALITATDYGRICARAGEQTEKPVLHVPHRSLTSDHLTAYGDVMEALAAGLPLSPCRSGRGNRIALVGYCWDRNEGDHRGNVAELTRIAEALGLEMTAPWLSGAPTKALRDVETADMIVSLPHGRRAAKTLARRLGCDLLQAELPFGLAATLRFVIALGAATGRSDAALAFVEAELKETLPPLAWLVPFALVHRRVGYVGDPHLATGLREIASLVGCSVPFLAHTCLPRHARDSAPDYGDLLLRAAVPADVRCLMSLDAPLPEPETVLRYPHVRQLEEALVAHGREQRLDLLVTNSFGFLTEGMGIVELGFPSYHTHALLDRPYLGTRGFLGMLERMVNALRSFEVHAARRVPRETP